MTNVLSFDGKAFKAISGSAGWNDSYFTNIDDAATGSRMDVVAGMTPGKANQMVPWLNRGVDMVASSIASMPFDLDNSAGDDLKDDPAYTSLLESISRNLYLVAASLWVYGAAYLWIETNALGHNITLRFLRARYMRPAVVGGKLVGFHYTDTNDQSVPHEIPLDRLIYFWMPNLDSAIRPGPAPAAVALGAASLLYALDSFAAGYFNSGAVKVTVFEVPGNTFETDKDKFQNFLNRALSGVRNAFRNVVVRFGVKPTVIGSDLKDTLADKLTELQRDNVAVALRVPPSVISGRVTDVLNARADKYTFYDATVIPLFKMIAETLNEQLFSRLGLTLESAEERLPIMQEIMLDTGKALELLTGRPVFKVDEARDIMGLDKWGNTDPDTAPAAAAPVVVAAPAQPAAATPPTADALQRPAPAKATQAQFNTWRRLALAYPGEPVGCPWDAELTTCKSRQNVRDIFEHHAPGGDEKSDVLVLAEALNRAAAALEETK